MATGPSTLFDLCHTMLGAIQAAFATDLVALPTTQYVWSGGQPPALCEQLVVSWDRIRAGAASVPESILPLRQGYMRTAELTVWIYRCVKVAGEEDLSLLSLPPLAELDNDAKVIMTDAFTLWRGITQAHFNGVFTDFCDAMSLRPVTPLPNEGGMGGCTMIIQTELS